jgi:hypothetical protein
MGLEIRGQFARWHILVGLGALGLLLIVLPHLVVPSKEGAWRSLVLISEGVGIAVLSSAILGLTLERWLMADLSKDVFLVAIGHHLPPVFREALRQELVRLAGFKFLCEKHLLRVKIDPIAANPDCVRVTMMVARTLRNISGSTQTLRGYTHIDEWGFDEKSKVIECRVESGQQVRTSDKSRPQPNMTVLGQTEAITLKRNETAASSSTSVEIRRSNDDLSIVFLSPTINPVIEVDCPSDFHSEISFGPDEEKISPEPYSNRKTLEGTYWPLQRMRVRWWRK